MTAEGVAVTLRPSPDPASHGGGSAGRPGGRDVGRPAARAADACGGSRRADTVCFCDVVVRDPFFIVGREPRHDFRLADLAGVRFASVAEVPTPWLCLQDDLRRAGIDPAALNRINGPSMAENAAALRTGTTGRGAVVPALRRGVGGGRRRPYLARGGEPRPDGLHHVGCATFHDLAARRDEFAAMVRGMHRTLRWMAATPGGEVARALVEFLPDVPPPIFAAAIERYRGLGLYASHPTMAREGFDRLQAAMLSGGALRHAVAFEDCVAEVL